MSPFRELGCVFVGIGRITCEVRPVKRPGFCSGSYTGTDCLARFSGAGTGMRARMVENPGLSEPGFPEWWKTRG